MIQVHLAYSLGFTSQINHKLLTVLLVTSSMEHTLSLSFLKKKNWLCSISRYHAGIFISLKFSPFLMWQLLVKNMQTFFHLLFFVLTTVSLLCNIYNLDSQPFSFYLQREKYISDLEACLQLSEGLKDNYFLGLKL